MSLSKIRNVAMFALLIGNGLAEEAIIKTTQEHTIPSSLEIAESYKKLTLMNKEAIWINKELALMCKIPTGDIIQAAYERHGPHTKKRVNMYMNELAQKALSVSPLSFPVGSIIVKDKKVTDEKDGVGGMIKREKGYDPENGDWEYFYYTNLEKIEAGKIQSCIACHSKAVHNDYVYGNWIKKKENTPLKAGERADQ